MDWKREGKGPLYNECSKCGQGTIHFWSLNFSNFGHKDGTLKPHVYCQKCVTRLVEGDYKKIVRRRKIEAKREMQNANRRF